MKKVLIGLAAIIISFSALAEENFVGVLKHNFTAAAVPVSQSGGKLQGPKIKAVYPTFFFVENEGRLFQIARLEIQGTSQYLVVRASRPGIPDYDNVVGLKSDAII